MHHFRPPHELDKDAIAEHPHWRRATSKYRRKKSRVMNLWIGSGLIMLFLSLPGVIALGLLTTFLSFAVLDETA